MVAREIIEDIRRNIVDGHYPDRGRLPTRDELTAYYATSKATVQKALATLTDEGFIISRGKLGTYVNPAAPNVNDIAVILPENADRITEWTLLLQLLQLNQREFGNRFGKKFRYFYIDHEQQAQSDYARIAREAECRHFAGVFFPVLPQRWMLEPFLANRIPIVVLTEDELPDVATIWLDYAGMIDQALAHFRQAGRRRVAFVCDARLPQHNVEDFLAAAARYGLETDPRHIIAISSQDPYVLRWLKYQLAATLDPAAGVDAMLITDYAFLNPILNLLSTVHLVPGRDIALASHCNFPRGRHQELPVKFFGFDVFEVMRSFLDALERFRAGRFAAAAHPLIAARPEL